MAYPKYWMDYHSAIGEGFQSITVQNIFSRRANITNTTSIIQTSVATNTFQYISSATHMHITSEAAADATAGANVRVIEIKGLNATYSETSEYVYLEGKTVKESSNTYIRIFSAEAISFGANKVAAGNIWVYNHGGAVTNGIPSTSAEKYLMIPAGDIEAKPCVYTIPAGKSGYLTAIVSTYTGALGEVELWKRPDGAQFTRVTVMDMRNRGIFAPPIPIAFAAKTDLELRAVGHSAAAAKVATGFVQLYVKP
jgi:hypothetical protein